MARDTHSHTHLNKEPTLWAALRVEPAPLRAWRVTHTLPTGLHEGSTFKVALHMEPAPLSGLARDTHTSLIEEVSQGPNPLQLLALRARLSNRLRYAHGSPWSPIACATRTALPTQLLRNRERTTMEECCGHVWIQMNLQGPFHEGLRSFPVGFGHHPPPWGSVVVMFGFK